jgi:phenylacetate-coenzyme A ligase PaaK-like adenylate-forming protein
MYNGMGLPARWDPNIPGAMRADLRARIFKISDPAGFNKTALDIFRFQAGSNPVYKEFISNLGLKPESVLSVDQIPFLPIEVFKEHKVITGTSTPVAIFESSGTSGSRISRHYVCDISLYEESFLTCFRYFYGDPQDYFIAGLLPSYIEKGNSSLVYMVERLIALSHDKRSRFFLNDNELLLKTLQHVKKESSRVMLIGVSYALLDLAEKYSPDLSGVIVVETGGMKGRRREIIRPELHSILKNGLKISSVNSEYGMTELLSQAWSDRDGLFQVPPWMKILIRETEDPLTILKSNEITGGINIIDLANIDSCSFIATSDLGKLHKDGGFEVLGRFDNSDVRGCNLMVQ